MDPTEAYEALHELVDEIAGDRHIMTAITKHRPILAERLDDLYEVLIESQPDDAGEPDPLTEAKERTLWKP